MFLTKIDTPYPNTIVDFPNTMVDLPKTMLDLPSFLTDCLTDWLTDQTKPKVDGFKGMAVYQV